jgi:hypothetical protein
MGRPYLCLLLSWWLLGESPYVAAQTRPGNRKAVALGRRTTPRPQGSRHPKPIRLASRLIDYETLTTSQLQLSRPTLATVRQSTARLLLVEAGSWLLCRATPRDTVWQVVRVPRWVYDREAESVYREQDASVRHEVVVKIDTCNMDQKGLPEVLLTCEILELAKSAINVRLIHLLDVSRTPKLLLSALIHVETGINWQSRGIKLGKELRVGAWQGTGSTDNDNSNLTPLLPGRYAYREGQLVWTGK